MLDFEYTDTFDYPAATVFALLADLHARRSWLEGILQQKVDPEGPARLGTTYFEAGKYGGYESEKTSTVTEFEPGRVLTLETVPGTKQAYRESYRVEPLSPTSCKVAFITNIDAPKMAALFMRQSMKKSWPENTKRLRETLATRA